MFSLSKATNYVDVLSINPEVDSGFMTFMLILAGVGVLAIFAGTLMGEEGMLFLVLGGALAIGGVIGVNVQQGNSENAKQEIIKGMASNIEDKYGADLTIDKSSGEFYKDLDKVKSYVLTFENGASANYKLSFQKSGEPVIVEDVAAPSVDELNGGEKSGSEETPKPTKSATPVKPVEPKTAPTPSELNTPTAAELEAEAKK